MFRSLTYSVTFPETGRKLSADLNFDPGYYAITGSNESGKTMILEMLRFLLFGTAALRGISDDYKTLTAAGAFDIKGVSYSIVRTMKSAELKRDGEIVASGVTTVNEKIGQILGFGLPIFDVACSINQGEVERLGSMTAGERKRLVDGVLGIDTLEIVAKWGVEEARVLEKEAETIRRGVVVPTEPPCPEGYEPSTEFDLDGLRAEARELAEITGFLSHPRSEPVKPQAPCAQTVDELRPLAEAQRQVRLKIEDLKARIAVLPSVAPDLPDDIDEQWEKYDAYMEALRWVRDNPRPKFNVTQLRVFRDDHTALQNIAEQLILRGHIEELKAKGTKPCPKCGEEIPLEADAIETLQAKHDAIIVPLDGVVPPDPPIELPEIERQLAYASQWSEAKFEQAKQVPFAGQPAIQRAMVAVLRAQVIQYVEREALEAELWTLSYDPTFEDLLAKRMAYEAALVNYDALHAEYLEWLEKHTFLSIRRMALKDADVALREAEQRHAAALRYEREVEAFLAATERYDAGVTEADRLEAEAKQHRKVKELMAVLRSLIKQHLMPSLNKVSSHLLRGMTGGQRSNIYVDENFNVVVDNQRLETLSGSGKACTNLAIRIALGQVLTNKVFSVLLADEIDASMDDFRAQNTSDVLDTLRNSISQILLVSHKQVEATNVIELGASVEHGERAEGAL